MSMRLDQFITSEQKEEPPKVEKPKPPKPKLSEKKAKAEEEELAEALEELEEFREAAEEEAIEETVFEAETPENTGTCYLLSVSYSGKKGKALVKLYDPEKQKIYFWYDNTGHQPYCLTDLPLELVRKDPQLLKHPGFDPQHCIEVKKHDLLHDKEITVTKVTAKDPLSIGRGRAIRDLLPTVWEAWIRYHDCYIYDRGLIPGYTYKIQNGNLVEVPYTPTSKEVKVFEETFKESSPEFKEVLKQWFPIFSCPAPRFKRIALDIEVYTPERDRVPDPRSAEYPIICVALVGSDGVCRVLLLKRPDVPEGDFTKVPEGVSVEFYDDERDLIHEIFKVLTSYPVVLTFNGDNFDLRYIWHRAQRLGIPKEKIPINMGRDVALLPLGVHIDLYKFFHNRAIQVYAFSNKYQEITLGAVATALLGISKIELGEETVTTLDYASLAAYCYRDAELTLKLTEFNDDMVMHFIVLLMRISKLSMEDVTRLGVSNWIRNLFYFEHRARGYLIPKQEDILAMKGAAVTKAIIKGKKYMGAMVIEPAPGVYFNVVVLDFASLYPSVIKQWNLSYETVRCPHDECKDNLVPNTPHWVCKKRKGLMSLITGALRDIRVYWFKEKSKDPSLPPKVRSWYKLVQQALKVFLNASYGVFGSDRFPLYCPPVAESTTAVGRYIIGKTIGKAKELGVTVLYGDTDSVFLHQPSEEQITTLLEWAERELGIDLEVDKIYSYVTFSKRKKNYLGVLGEGRVDIKGLVGKKRNTPPFLKDAFNMMVQVLSQVKSPEDFEKAKARIREIAQECYRKLKSQQVPLDQLVFKVMLTKDVHRYTKTTPQHVKAAKQLEAFGRIPKPGDIIAFVKVITPPGVKPVQLARIDEIDVEKYVAHMETTFEQVLDALGIDFDEVLGMRRLDIFS